MVSLGSSMLFRKWSFLLFFTAVVVIGGTTFMSRTVAAAWSYSSSPSSGSSTDESVGDSAKSALQREIETLKEQIEQFEMKHETLEAATDTFRIKAKTLKTKLDEERQRYDILMADKRSLEDEMEETVKAEVIKSTASFQDYKIEQANIQKDLKAKIESLTIELSDLSEERTMVEQAMKQKLDAEQSRYQRLEEDTAAKKAQLQGQITDLTNQLADSDMRVVSLDQKLRSIIEENKEKDQSHKRELQKRIEEATVWEKRIKELTAENSNLLSVVQSKDNELLEAATTINEKRDEIDILNDRLKVKEEMISNHLTTIQSKETQQEVLKRKIMDIQNKLDESIIREADLQENAESLSSFLVNAKRELAEANKGLEEAAKVSDDLVSATEEIKNLRQQNSFLKDELTESEHNSLQCATAVEGMMNDYEKVSKEMNSTKHQLATIEVLYTKCKNELTVSESQTRQLQYELETLSTEKEAEMDQTELHNSELRDLKSRYSEMESMALKQSKDLAESQSQNLQLAQDLSSNMRQLNETSLKLEELETKYEILTTQQTVQTSSTVHSARLSQLEERNQQLTADLVAAQKALSTATAAAAAAATRTEEPKRADQSKSSSSSSSSSSSWTTIIRDLFKWLDKSLYYVLRSILRIPGYVYTTLPKLIQPMSDRASQASDDVASTMTSNTSPIKSRIDFLHTIHTSLVEQVESTAAAVSIFVRGGETVTDDKGGWIGWIASFVHGHSQLLVVLGEVITALLCADFVISSMIRPTTTKRSKPMKIQPMKVPTSADASLLRKAKTSWN